MRMERQPREGEVLPNERSRLLRPFSVINVELYDDAHITLWIRGAPTGRFPLLCCARVAWSLCRSRGQAGRDPRRRRR
jgi:hypothetical protein